MLFIRLFAVTILLSISFEANAAITVKRAEYKAGILVVRGQTAEANETVTLDGLYRAHSNRLRSFHFRIRYRPRNCVVRLTTGSDIFHATVARCRPMRSRSVPGGR